MLYHFESVKQPTIVYEDINVSHPWLEDGDRYQLEFLNPINVLEALWLDEMVVMNPERSFESRKAAPNPRFESLKISEEKVEL
jgi:hypothetical protein